MDVCTGGSVYPSEWVDLAVAKKVSESTCGFIEKGGQSKKAVEFFTFGTS